VGLLHSKQVYVCLDRLSSSSRETMTQRARCILIRSDPWCKYYS
jgi:hypothetical protein